ncbi:MAG: sulfatase-like hydrolase/transferase [Atribacterota bacterium]
MLNCLKSQNIENIVIFVCDSLRWDYMPLSILDMGISMKTVASSLYTASSFPSIISGLYPPKTGVHTWEDLLPKNIRGLLELEGYNSSLWCETTWTDSPPDKSAVHRIFGNPKGISLKDIEPPFIYIEDDKGGHCPYGLPFGEYMGGGCPDFFREYGKKGRKELITQYKKGIGQSVENFKKRIKTLVNRRLTKSTLVIFTSDHGELLGEYGGLTSHGRPSCPELVYVPTVFIHPSLKPDKVNDSVIRHVDFYPTIVSILNKSISYEVDGINLTKDSLPTIGLNFRLGGYYRSKNKIKNWMNYESCSVWDFHGGNIFHGLGKIRALLFFSYKIFIQRHPEFNFMYENLKNKSSSKLTEYKRAFNQLTSSHVKYLKPKFSKNNAKKIIDNYLKESVDFREKNRIKKTIFKLKEEGKIGNL